MDIDVVVIGAGPTGLLLAGDLAESGVRVTVLERRGEESNLTRAFAVQARTMEELQIRGVAEQLAATGLPVPGLDLFGSARVRMSGLPTEFNGLRVTPQPQVERVLTQRIERFGVPVVRGAEVTGLTQDADGVDVLVRSLDGGTRTYRARYAVGCDGVHSAVRQSIGLPYPGKAVLRSIMLADVRLNDPPADGLAVNAVGDALAFIAPFGDGWYRIIAWNRHHQVDDSVPMTLEEVRETTRRALGTDFGMHDARWMSRFHSDERQVPSYRVGRVLLAGDAAHCHSPAGGMGMNTGLQDAANLGWKLAAAVTGWGDERLLETYQAERHPVGRQAVRVSGGLIRLALIRPRWGRWLRNLAASVLLRLPPVARRAAGTISGIDIRYPAPAGADRRVGTRAPNVELREGRLYDALRGGRFVLLGERAHRLRLPSQVCPATRAAAVVASSDTLILVRPDGYVGWIGTDAEFPGWAREYFGSFDRLDEPHLSAPLTD